MDTDFCISQRAKGRESFVLTVTLFSPILSIIQSNYQAGQTGNSFISSKHVLHGHNSFFNCIILLIAQFSLVIIMSWRVAMFELYCPSVDMIHGEWQIHTKHDGAFAGNFTAIIAHCIKKLEISKEDLDVAVQEMCKNNHNCAQFGIYRHFIYTYNREQKKAG
jgi:hypothetical protein